MDSGKLADLVSTLDNLGPVHVLTGGTMARVAVLDSPLRALVDITRKMHTSDALSHFSNKDVIILANCGKTPATGIFFGQIVSSRVDRSIIQVERPGARDGRVILWYGADGDKADVVERVARYLADALALTLHKTRKKTMHVEHKGGTDIRIVHGAQKGERILVEGTVVGMVTGTDVEIIARDGRIVDIRGAIIKDHGLEKIGHVDLETAYIKTGYLRRNNKAQRRSNVVVPARHLERGKVIIINHAADRTFEAVDERTICAITIGDDTTAICSDILSRIGIPVLGITDGDADGIYHTARAVQGSIIIRLQSGSDDEIGRLLEEQNVIGDGSYTLAELKTTVIAFLRRTQVRFTEYPAM
ncbi:MAG: DUF2117 domain-containing protein [Euryarchaeota archaeon]|nr:DUF2117 domain-containing protein [Euryarchaeota archaeon]